MYELLPLLKQLWLVWFLVLFLGIVFWAFRPSARRRFEADAMIPLNDDPSPARNNR